jgi:hypothetical protein
MDKLWIVINGITDEALAGPYPEEDETIWARNKFDLYRYPIVVRFAQPEDDARRELRELEDRLCERAKQQLLERAYVPLMATIELARKALHAAYTEPIDPVLVAALRVMAKEPSTYNQNDWATLYTFRIRHEIMEAFKTRPLSDEYAFVPLHQRFENWQRLCRSVPPYGSVAEGLVVDASATGCMVRLPSGALINTTYDDHRSIAKKGETVKVEIGRYLPQPKYHGRGILLAEQTGQRRKEKEEE